MGWAFTTEAIFITYGQERISFDLQAPTIKQLLIFKKKAAFYLFYVNS